MNLLDLSWDNLIILDACRFDTFLQVNDIKGLLVKQKSVGTSTWQWFKNTFKEQFYNIDYFSCNPYISYLYFGQSRKTKFKYLYNLWEIKWDINCNTVQPSSVNKFVMKNYSGRKTIIHYMQPHLPFIGDMKYVYNGFRYNKEIIEGLKVKKSDNVWSKFIKGEITKPQIYGAYKKTLKLVLNEVKELIPVLQGRTVIASDHGNAFGEQGHYAHKQDTWIPCLYEIPCLFVE